MKDKVEGRPGFFIRYDIERPEKALLDRLKKFTTPNLSDGLNRFGAMNHLIKPINKNSKLIGPAITVKVRPADNLMIHKAIDVAKPGDVLVIDTGESYTNAVWGELMTLSAIKKGIAGIVVDGGVRDIVENREHDFTIFAKFIAPNACDKDGPGEINVPVTCGGIPVSPGDIIAGDDNGVVVIPREMVDLVMQSAESKIAYEEKRKFEIQKGKVLSPKIDNILKDKGINV